jgi:HEAT repeat protein
VACLVFLNVLIKRGSVIMTMILKKTILSMSILFVIPVLFSVTLIAQQKDKQTDRDEMAEITNLLDSIANYEYGQSRENLTLLTDLLREALKSSDLRIEIEEKFIDFLESNASLAAKQFICERLSLFGSKKSVPTLIAMLERTATVDMALFALERINDIEVDKQLCAVLNGAQGRVKVGIITALGNRQATTCVSEIVHLLNTADSTIVSASIAALGQIGGKEATKALAKFRKKEIYIQETTDAYLKCAERFVIQDQLKEAYAIFNELFKSETSAQIRYAALRGIIKTSDRKPSDIILDIIRSDQKDLRTIAIQLVKEIPQSDDISSISTTLPELSFEGQTQLLSTLAGRKDPATRQAILQARKSENEHVRIAALKALGVSGDAGVVPILSEVAATNKGLESEAARESLYRLDDPDIDNAILSSISSADRDMKIEYIRAVSERHILEGIDVLFKAVQDSNLKVRIEAIKSLKAIATEQHLNKTLDFFLAALTEQERKEWVKTIVSVASRNSAQRATTQSILSRIRDVRDTIIHASLLELLGELGDAAALPVLTEELNNKNSEIAAAAIRGLSYWPDAAPIDDLLHVARKAANNQHRVLALRGFVKLIPAKSTDSVEERINLYRSALELAENSDEQRMVLSGLSNVEDIEALKFAANYLEDQQLQQEAVAAVLKIAQNTDEQDLKEFKAILYKARQVALNEAIKEEYTDLLKEIEE